jgi:hypothetical protein
VQLVPAFSGRRVAEARALSIMDFLAAWNLSILSGNWRVDVGLLPQRNHIKPHKT